MIRGDRALTRSTYMTRPIVRFSRDDSVIRHVSQLAVEDESIRPVHLSGGRIIIVLRLELDSATLAFTAGRCRRTWGTGTRRRGGIGEGVLKVSEGWLRRLPGGRRDGRRLCRYSTSWRAGSLPLRTRRSWWSQASSSR